MPAQAIPVQYAVFTVQADADSYAAACDVALGYPRTGINVGLGRHGPNVATQKHRPVVKHPTLALWGYPATPDILALAVAVPVTGSVQTIDPVAWGAAAVAQVG